MSYSMEVICWVVEVEDDSVEFKTEKEATDCYERYISQGHYPRLYQIEKYDIGY